MSDGKPKDFVTHPNDYNVSTYPETTLYKLFRKKNMDGYFDKAKYFLVFGNKYVMLLVIRWLYKSFKSGQGSFIY